MHRGDDEDVSNEITDISPLVANTGIGPGDYVNITYNYLDTTPGSENMQDIEALIARGANVYYEPQRDPGETPEAIEDYLESAFWITLGEEAREKMSFFDIPPVE